MLNSLVNLFNNTLQKNSQEKQQHATCKNATPKISQLIVKGLTLLIIIVIIIVYLLFIFYCYFFIINSLLPFRLPSLFLQKNSKPQILKNSPVSSLNEPFCC